MILFIGTDVFAEKIVLKSGQTIEGKIVEKADKYIKINFMGVNLTYYLDEVESIDGEKISEIERQPAKTVISSAVSLQDLLKEITDSRKDVKSLKVSRRTETDMPGLYSMIAIETCNIDIENRRIFVNRQTEMKTLFGKLRDMSKQKIDEARARGATEDEVRRIQQTTDYAISQMQNMDKKMKNMETKTYFVGQTVFYNFQDKWFKMECPAMNNLWDNFSLNINDKSPLDNPRKILESSPCLKEMFASLSNFIFDLWNKDNCDVEEMEFEGRSAFCLKLKPEQGREILEKMMREKRSSDFAVQVYSSKLFVSKENYFVLGKLEEMEIYTPQGKIFIKIHSSYDYPGSSVILPVEAQARAIPISDEKEIKNAAEDLLKGIFK